mmetsp:Transcript_153769/g.493063  ORF Transcript_153769/g.493063 Transcript_153769/m.493063 type:complete len:615 (-) Transcript_153769:11-1855(-)
MATCAKVVSHAVGAVCSMCPVWHKIPTVGGHLRARNFACCSTCVNSSRIASSFTVTTSSPAASASSPKQGTHLWQSAGVVLTTVLATFAVASSTSRPTSSHRKALSISVRFSARKHAGCNVSRGIALHAQSSPLVTGEWEPLLGGAFCRGLCVTVPLRHTLNAGEGDRMAGGTIQVFAREIVSAKFREKVPELPALLFLQGGPGFPAARPTSAQGGWLGRALEEYRVVLLDQRGTGRSTPITAQTLKHLSPEEHAEYLSHFRADSIVRDCEELRHALGLGKWSLLGQSFGGFCCLTYLSFHSGSLDAVYITGGLPPMMRIGADEVYRATFRRVLVRNRLYYRRYPGDVARVQEIVAHLEALGPQGARLPGGGRLTPRRFLSLGLMLGGGDGIEAMHWLVESAFVDVRSSAGGASRELDDRFLAKVEMAQSFDTNPMYWLLHEAIYCDGCEAGASSWSADCVLREAEFRTLFGTAIGEIPASDAEGPLLFTGEMVFPWFAEDFISLGGFKQAADLLATRADWPNLYDKDALRDTKVPVSAAMYYDDMYVERAFSEETADLLGPNCQVWVTNEFQHSGIRDDGKRVLDTLMKMVRGEVQRECGGCGRVSSHRTLDE